MSNKKGRLLVIDSEPTSNIDLKKLLEGSYDLTFVESAEIAWELLFFFGEPFDLIIDVILPKYNDLEIIEKIKKINPWVPILILTVNSTQELAEKACSLGVSGYIKKPYNEEEFLKKIRAIIGEAKDSHINLVSPRFFLNKKVNTLHPVIAKCLEEIHKRFHTTFTIEELSSICSISKHHLCKLFKKNCDITIKDYLTMLRMETAKQLLENSAYKISMIHEILGYKSRTHFFYTFKKTVGVSPLSYRKTSNNHLKDTIEIQK